MLHRAQYCYGKLSLCLSVILKYRDYLGRNTSKVVSWLASLGCLHFADSNNMDLLQREHPSLVGIRVGYGKWLFAFGTSEALISLRRAKYDRGYCWGQTGSPSHTVAANINDLGWPCRVILHSVAKHMHHINIVSHSVCFYAVNDYSKCSTSCYHKASAILLPWPFGTWS